MMILSDEIDVEEFLIENSRFSIMKNLPNYIRTFSGLKFNLDNIENNKVEIDDLVNALFKIPRFGGHTKNNYTVGDHLVNCVNLAEINNESQDIIDALALHDCSEAYLGDIPSPIKKKLLDYQKLEHKVQQLIYDQFNCPCHNDQRVKFYDIVSLILEGHLIMKKIDDDFEWDLKSLPDSLILIDFNNFTAPNFNENFERLNYILKDIEFRRT